MQLADALRPNALQDNHDTFCHLWVGGRVTRMTYADLYDGGSRYAAALRSAGVQPDTLVLITLRHGADLLYAFFGAMFAGCIPSFLPPPTVRQDPGLYWSSHRQLFERIGPAALVTYRDNLAQVTTCIAELPVAVLIADDVATEPSHVPTAHRGGDDIALLQHSSGTTGLKKGVALSFDAIDRQVSAYADAIALTPHDCIVSWLPLYHDMGLIACLIVPFASRVPLVLLDPLEWVARPRLLFEAIAAHEGTLTWLPNFAFHHLMRTVDDTSPIDLSRMRAFIDCSEPCKADTFTQFAARFERWGVRADQLQVCYAMAEAVFAVTQTPLGRTPRTAQLHGQTRLSAGVPITGWQVQVVGTDGQPLPDDAIGEIAIFGGSLFSGYFKLPEQTAKKFRNGWYLTGDLGCRHDGEIFITGRVDDLIIVHGKNLYAHDVEATVSQIPGVRPGRAVAVGLFSPDAGTDELLIIAEASGAPDTYAGLARSIKAAVAQDCALVPRTVHVVGPGWLVKTTSGKLSRTDNLRKYTNSLLAIAL